MSSELFFKDSSQINERPIIEVENLENKANEGWLPREVIPWSKSLSNELLAFFMECNYPYRNILEIPFKDPLRSEIRRFFISLDGYIESSNPVVPEKDILYGATLIDYAETLKRIKRKSFQTTWNAENFSYPDWWHNTPHYLIRDIGDVFNYSYLIFWEEPEPDDYLAGFDPVVINDKTLSLFKETLRGILPDRESFQKIEPMEILKTISSSSSYDEKKKKSSPHYKLKPDRLFFSKNIHPVKRSVIRVSPNNTRDSVLLCPQDLNTISLVDKQTMEILSKMKGHIHLRNKDLITHKCKKFLENYSVFLQRDLKKEGITKPRELLKAMLEVLNSEYPDIEIFENTDFYDSFSIVVNDEVMYPDRGHGLGMANSLTTLMQLTIHKMVIYELSDDIPDIDIDTLCINDDFTAGGNEDYHLDAYWDKEDEILTNLSIRRVDEKSFRSTNRFVIAERYFTPWGEYEKESYQRRELLLPLTCYNITHAKQYYIAAQTYTNCKFHNYYLEELTTHWGYEFFPTEFVYPSKVGGWTNSSLGGVDLSIKLLEDLPFKSYVYSGYKAVKYEAKVRPKGDKYLSPIMSLLGRPKVPKEFSVYLDDLSIHEITFKYGRILKNSSREFKIYWDKLYKNRQRIFKQGYDDIPLETFVIKLKKRYCATSFYPASFMISHYEPGNFIQTNIDDPYIDPNPTMSMISKFNEISYLFKETFSIRFSNKDEFTKKTSGLLSKEVERSTKSELANNYIIGRFDEILWPKGTYDPQEQYFNPIGIGRAAAIMDWGKGFPVLLEQYEDILISEKREVFGRFLSIDELIFCSTNSISREVIKMILDKEKSDLIESIRRICAYVDHIEAQTPKDPIPVKYTYNEDEYVVEMSDIIEPGIPKFWNWRNDRESYTSSEEVLGYLQEISCLITILTVPRMYSVERRLEEVEKFERKSRVHSIILNLSNIRGLLNPKDLFADGSDSEGCLGLFDEG